MAHGELSREVLEGLAKAAGIDLRTMPVERLMQGETAAIWRGIEQWDALHAQWETPANVSRLEESGHGS
jgi:hypothetical protein